MDYLSHHGIEGQQWGKRNGPPYPLDKKVSAQIQSGAHPITPSKDIGHKPSRKELSKYARSLSDEQLRDATNRLNAERNYINAVHSPTNREKVAEFVKKQATNVSLNVIDQASKEMGKRIANQIIHKTMGDWGTKAAMQSEKKDKD